MPASPSRVPHRLQLLTRGLMSSSASADGAASGPVRAIVPNLPAGFIARLEGVALAAGGRALELLVAQTPQDAIELLRTESDISVLIDAVEMGAPTRWACTEEMLSAAQPSLAWVQSGQAGQDAAPLALYASKGVVLTNAAVITGSHLAEHILAFMLAFSRQLPLHFANQQTATWSERAGKLFPAHWVIHHAHRARCLLIPDATIRIAPFLCVAFTMCCCCCYSEYPPGELTSSTILVLGLGGAGLGTCQRAKAFGMTVLATRRRPNATDGAPPPDAVDEIFGGDRDSLLAVLPRADYVAVCCPLTPETRGLFDKEAFAVMKPSSVIMNVGRGPIINTADLVEALESGEIGGAGCGKTHKFWAPARFL